MAFSSKTDAPPKTRRKKKKTAFQKTVDKLDRIFGEWIRLTEMDPETNRCRCVTCRRWKPWHGHSVHAGHFIEKSYTKNMRVRFKRKNVHVQCYGCNKIRSGNRYEYFKFIESQYGPGTSAELEMYATKPFNEKIFNFQKKMEFYKEAVKKLKAEKLNGQLTME